MNLDVNIINLDQVKSTEEAKDFKALDFYMKFLILREN